MEYYHDKKKFQIAKKLYLGALSVIIVSVLVLIISLVLYAIIDPMVIITLAYMNIFIVIIGITIMIFQVPRVFGLSNINKSVECLSKEHDLKGFLGKNFSVLKIEGLYFIYYVFHNYLFILHVLNKTPITDTSAKKIKKPIILDQKPKLHGDVIGVAANSKVHKQEDDFVFIDPEDKKWYKGEGIIFSLLIPLSFSETPGRGRERGSIRRPSIIFQEKDKFEELINLIKNNIN